MGCSQATHIEVGDDLPKYKALFSILKYISNMRVASLVFEIAL